MKNMEYKKDLEGALKMLEQAQNKSEKLSDAWKILDRLSEEIQDLIEAVNEEE